MPHVHNALHHFTELQDAYRTVLGEADAGFNGIERAGETITPTLDLWSRPEWYHLRGSTLWSAFHEQAAVPLELSFIGIRNPAGSRVLAVLDRIRVWTGTSGLRVHVYHGTVSATDVDGSEQLVPRDTRLPLAGVTQLVKIHGAGAAAIGNDAYEEIIALEAFRPWELWGSRILAPGFEVRFYCLTANSVLGVNAMGYSWVAQAGELS